MDRAVMAPEVEASEAKRRASVAAPQDRLPEAVFLPLVIGVTGHRDLRAQDVDRLKEEVRKAFGALKGRYPNTPLVLLSALAEGADRLVTEVALSSGMGLIVVLPMPRALYEEDFRPPTALPRPEGSETALDEFRRLVDAAGEVLELPLLAGEDELSRAPARRAFQYEQVGAFIALHSQVLLALWDGVSPVKVGGTSEVIRFQLTGVPRTYAPFRTALDALDSGPVYHLVTPRAEGDGGTVAPAFTFRKGFPSKDHGTPEWTAVQSPKHSPPREGAYQRVYQRIDAFNRNITALAGVLPQRVNEIRGRIFPTGEDRALEHGLQALLARFGVADAMALRFQALTRQMARWLFILTAFAALVLGLYADGEFERMASHHPLLLLAYVGAVLVGLGVYFWARWGDFQNRFQDYRAMAEGLRVQFFWRLAGVRGSVADHYLLKQKGELDWIRQALRVWGLQSGVRGEGFESGAIAAGGSLEPTRVDLVLTHWVDDQLGYYTRAAQGNHRYQRVYGPLGKAALIGGITLAFVVLIQQLRDWFLRHQFGLSGWTTLAMTVPLVAAGLLEGYAHVMAFSDHAKQYGRMSLVFGKAKEVLRGLTAPEDLPDRPFGKTLQDVQHVLRDLGKEALAENGDWLLLHRERPLEFHSPA
jgi:hypothetical protein